MTPKGTLFIIGGHEDKGIAGQIPDIYTHEIHAAHFAILGSLMHAVPKSHHIIEIIAAASSIPAEMEELYMNAYKNAGFKKVAIIRIDSREQASNEDYVRRIKYAHSVFFTGGDQKKLVSLLGDTPVLTEIKNKYHNDKNFIVAGTSAGAMSLPAHMIARGVIEEALLASDLEMNDGLGFIDGLIVDTHFVKRGRFGRLAHAVARTPGARIGIGLGEDAAMIITEGNEAKCVGSGMVIVIDGSDIGATNIATADDITPIAIENLKVHIVAEGCKYLIAEKKFILSGSK